MDISKININVSTGYNIFVGQNILDTVGEELAKLKSPCNVVIISDKKVFALYGNRLKSSIENKGYNVLSYIVERGETSKNFENYENILEYMAENNIYRSDIVVALGGGVVGDLAGFVAATYNRGMDFVQVPTTFLADIDSSVGGKTAINLKSGKNLVGAFKQPILVVCDVDLIKTLEEEYFADGVSEAIKYAILKDEEFFEYFEKGGFSADDLELNNIIVKAIGYKKEIVTKDEFDLGDRQLLNLGHSIGHALERAHNYKITHGHAVAIGMALISKVAYAWGYCNSTVPKRIENTLKSNNLPYDTDISLDEVYENMLRDKKASTKSITLIIPEKIGKCALVEVEINRLKEFLAKGWCSES